MVTLLLLRKAWHHTVHKDIIIFYKVKKNHFYQHIYEHNNYLLRVEL